MNTVCMSPSFSYKTEIKHIRCCPLIIILLIMKKEVKRGFVCLSILS